MKKIKKNPNKHRKKEKNNRQINKQLNCEPDGKLSLDNRQSDSFRPEWCISTIHHA